MAKLPTKESFLNSLGLRNPDPDRLLWRNEALWGDNNVWDQQTEGQLLFWDGDKFWGDINLWQSLFFLSTELAVELLASSRVLAQSSNDIMISLESDAYIQGKTESFIQIENRVTFHTSLPPTKIGFWGNDFSPLVYVTSILVPAHLVGVNLSVKPIFRSGELFSIEYGFGASPKAFWGGRSFWSDARYTFWGNSMYPETYYPMPNTLKVTHAQFVFFRIKSTDKTLAILEDIKYIFDVEDKVETYDNIFIPAEIFRLPKPQQNFVDIVNVNGTPQYDEVGLAHSLYFVDRGLRENGMIVEGPAVVLLDINKNMTSGTADITVRGY